MEVSPIALLTDFGLRDPYAGVMKGVIASINPDAPVIDITHDIQPQNIPQASFILKKTYRYFPSGTIFVCVVDPGVGSTRKALAVKTRNYFFIAPDNGLLADTLEEKEVGTIVEIKNTRYLLTTVSNTFHGRDIFAPAAAHLSHGIPIKDLGPRVFSYQGMDFPEVFVGKYMVRGKAVYADHYGNLITNIDAHYLKDREIHAVRFRNYELKRINRTYDESLPGELLAVVGSFDTLEISVNHGSAASLLSESQGMDVEIWFDAGQAESETVL